MKRILSLCLLCWTMVGSARHLPAYQIFRGTGKAAGFDAMLHHMRQQEVILFGELHNNPIAHWLQLELTRSLGSQKPLVLGAEMFEADNQQAVNDYLTGKLTLKGLDTSARLWKNFRTDYQPLLDYAREKQFPFIATNIPRKYASLVARSGLEALDALPPAEKAWMVPLPMKYDSTLPCYKNIFEAMGGHGGVHMPKAQAVKDATMAYFILQHLKPGVSLVHYNGAYHSDNYESINWYLRQEQPSLRIGTISTVSQKSLRRLNPENQGKADFIIVVDEDMTSTY